MQIFIDESGSFVYTDQKAAWSSVSAVVIPESALSKAESALKDFKAENGCLSIDELKLGKVEDELSYFRFLGKLDSANCTLYGIATDAHLNAPEAIRLHKEATAQGLLANLDKMHHEAGRRSIEYVADQVRRLSPQLYIQFICQISLMYHVVSQAINYYAQHEPESLSTFVWRVDQKAIEKKTEYEEAFEKLSPAYLQMLSLSDPMMRVAEFDYSHLVEYEFPEGQAPKYLKEDYGFKVDLTRALNIQKVIRGDIQFLDSKGSFGLQISDLLSAGLRRCLRSGFKDNIRAAAFLGRLMIQRVGNQYPLLLSSLGRRAVVDEPTAVLIRMMRSQQRPMLKRVAESAKQFP